MTFLCELALYSEDIRLWQVSTGCENARGGAGAAGSDESLAWKIFSDRSQETGTDMCYDVFAVNEKVCYKFNIGPGEDKEMFYEKE